jgi:hypothetical protein
MQRVLMAKKWQSNDNKEDPTRIYFLFVLKFRRYYVKKTYPEVRLSISQLGHYL